MVTSIPNGSRPASPGGCRTPPRPGTHAPTPPERAASAAWPGSLPDPVWRGGSQSRRVDRIRSFRTPASGVLTIRPEGTESWVAGLDFEASFELDQGLLFVDRCRYEYRQFMRGGARFTCDGRCWENLPVEGLSAQWVPDGAAVGARWQAYGLRPLAFLASACPGEAYGSPDATAAFGSRYRLHRHLELRGVLPAGTQVVELEVEFQARIIEVERDPDTDVSRTQAEIVTRQWTCRGQMVQTAPDRALRPDRG